MRGWLTVAAASAVLLAPVSGAAQERAASDEDAKLAVGVFQRAVRAPGPRARQRAVWQVAQCRHPDVVKALAPLVEHRLADVSRAAAAALAHLGWGLEAEPRGAVVTILARAATRHAEQRPPVTLATLAALEALGDRRAVRPLLALLKTKQPVVLERTADTLGALGDPRAVEAMLELLVRLTPAKAKAGETPNLAGGFPSPESRALDAVRRALHAITGHDADDPARWRQWWKGHRAKLLAKAAKRGTATRARYRPALLRDREPPVGPPSVDRAVEHGCRYLLERLTRPPVGYGSGFREGERALSVLALAHAGYAEDERVLAATEAIAGGLSGGSATVYVTAIECMALERVNGRAYQEAIAKRAWLLVNAQREDGGWGYVGPWVHEIPETIRTGPAKLTRFPGVQLTGPGRQQAADAPAPPMRTYRVDRREWFRGPWADFSNTQFAVLGLHAAERAHVVCPDSTWVAVAKLHRPQRGGGWGYHVDQPPMCSMTAGGLSTLAVLREVTQRAPREQQTAVRRAFAYLEPFVRRLGTPARPKGLPGMEAGLAMLDYYWLYSLERACVLWNRETVGSAEWYQPIAGRLVRTQRSDGAWGVANDGNRGHMTRGRFYMRPSYNVINTAFAVLILRRAAPIQRTAQETGHGAGGAGK